MNSVSREQTEAVLQHHLQAFEAADLDETMVDYGEQAVLIHPDGVQQGHEQIRALFEKIYAIFPASATTQMLVKIVEGEIAYTVWSGESQQLDIRYATDTFVIREGKIVAQTSAGLIDQKEM